MEQTWQLEPGTLLKQGKYRIVRLLGNDGFGLTYEAENIPKEKTVVIKEFFMDNSCGRDGTRMTIRVASQGKLVGLFLERFIKEAKLMKELDHKRVIRVTETFKENDTAYYVMRYLPGGSLSELVKKVGPLPEAQAVVYIRQAAEGLDYIHSQNAVHLDVRPSNILLNKLGKAVLADFGGSKQWSARSFWQLVTSEGEEGMTGMIPIRHNKGYAPLELGNEDEIKQFKPSTDIYSLGATLYFLVTGAAPPDAADLNKFGWHKPEIISPKLWQVIETAMRPRRIDRPQTIAEFLSLLDLASEEVMTEATAASEPAYVHEEPAFEPAPEAVPSPEPSPEPAPEPVYVHEEPASEPAPEPVYVQEPASEPVYVQEPVYVHEEPAPEPVIEPEPVVVKPKKPVDAGRVKKAASPVVKKKKKSRKSGFWVALGIALAAVLAVFLFFGKSRQATKAEKERAHYDNMVGICRDSIRVWGDFRGTVPTVALDLLSQIKQDEDLYGKYVEGYDASPDIARRLVEKMETAKRKWEAAGDAQKSVNPSMALECYSLALQLAESVESVETEILELDSNDVMRQGRSAQIRRKIDSL